VNDKLHTHALACYKRSVGRVCILFDSVRTPVTSAPIGVCDIGSVTKAVELKYMLYNSFHITIQTFKEYFLRTQVLKTRKLLIFSYVAYTLFFHFIWLLLDTLSF